MTAALISIASVALYLAGFAAWLSKSYVSQYRDFRRRYACLEWDNEQRSFALFFGGLVASVWPVSVVVWLCWRLLQRTVLPGLERHGDLPGSTRADRKRLRAEQRRIDLDAEIARMEKEAGL